MIHHLNVVSVKNMTHILWNDWEIIEDKTPHCRIDVDEIITIISRTDNNTQRTGRQSLAACECSDHHWDDLVGERAIHVNPVGWH